MPYESRLPPAPGVLVTLVGGVDMWVMSGSAVERGLVSSPEERFVALFERTHRPLLAYAVRRVAEPADAADVVAETFLVAWRRLDEVPAGEQARPWLFGVARRVLANLYRGERRRHALADRLRACLPDVVPPPEPGGSAVLVAMQQLSDEDQELLRLVAWEQLARDEIALVLGVSRGVVRVRLHRARQRLVKEMQILEAAGHLDRDRSAVKRTPGAGQVSSGWGNTRPAPEEGR